MEETALTCDWPERIQPGDMITYGDDRVEEVIFVFAVTGPRADDKVWVQSLYRTRGITKVEWCSCRLDTLRAHRPSISNERIPARSHDDLPQTPPQRTPVP